MRVKALVFLLFFSSIVNADPSRLIEGKYAEKDDPEKKALLEISCSTICELITRIPSKSDLPWFGAYTISNLQASPDLVSEVNKDISNWNSEGSMSQMVAKKIAPFKQVLPFVDTCFRASKTKMVLKDQIFDMSEQSNSSFPSLYCGNSADSFSFFGFVYKSVVSDNRGFLPGTIFFKVSAN